MKEDREGIREGRPEKKEKKTEEDIEGRARKYIQ